MAFGLLYLIFCQLIGWLGLLARGLAAVLSAAHGRGDTRRRVVGRQAAVAGTFSGLRGA
jgi:hypothetical protein